MDRRSLLKMVGVAPVAAIVPPKWVEGEPVEFFVAPRCVAFDGPIYTSCTIYPEIVSYASDIKNYDEDQCES